MSDENDSGVFTLATQGSITLVGNVFGKGLGFAFVAVATRLVTPAEYGVFTLGLSIVLFAQGFASLNIYRSIDYFVPQYLSDSNYGRAKRTLQSAFIIGGVMSILGAVVLFLARERLSTIFNEPRVAAVLSLLILLIPLQTLLRMLITSFNSIKKMKYRVLVKDLISPLIRTLGVILLVSTGAGLLGLVGGYLLGVALAVVCGLAFLLYEADWIRNAKSSPISNRSLVSYSLPLVLAGMIYSLVGQIDYFVIGYFLSSTDVGQYRIAYLLAVNLLIVLAAITPVFKPMVSENRSNTPLLESRYQLATRWITMLTIPPALTLILAPDIYLSLLFTEEYTAASAAVVALTIGYLLNASFGPEGMILEGLGHTRLTLINTFMLVSVNGILNILLVPQLGILGAGIATGTALAVTGLLGVGEIYLLRSITPISWKLLRVWIAIIFPIIVGWATMSLDLGDIQTALVLPISIFTGYILGIRATNGFTDDDRKIASRIDGYLGYSVIYPIIS
ncbi:flippase [Saliphagus infecundisoli]|uniref:Flippase n=1 Tax=Saliphagus infecundisoli TaxID=1849069 RepID=A0ABD5QKV3_9EURY|nr:flippase [Saliphagus infecundisoli]